MYKMWRTQRMLMQTHVDCLLEPPLVVHVLAIVVGSHTQLTLVCTASCIDVPSSHAYGTSTDCQAAVGVVVKNLRAGSAAQLAAVASASGPEKENMAERASAMVTAALKLQPLVARAQQLKAKEHAPSSLRGSNANGASMNTDRDNQCRSVLLPYWQLAATPWFQH